MKKTDYNPYIEDLKEAGFSDKQATGIVRFQHETSNGEIFRHLVTKEEFKKETTQIREDFKKDLSHLETRIELKIERSTNRITWTVIGMGFAFPLIDLIMHFTLKA